MTKYLGAVSLSLLFAACSGNGQNPNDMSISEGGVVDLLQSGSDGGKAGKIGSPCVAVTDCTDGKTPVCWKKNLFNDTKYALMPGGYCSSACTANSDCGTNGTCEDFGAQGKWCLSNCMGPNDCRTQYGCFTGDGTCFVKGFLNCDPTAGDGTCTSSPSGTGGCQRYIFGTGKTGFCNDLCEVGTNTCAPGNNGARHCIVDDETQNGDSTGLFGDKWKGPVCFDDPPAGTPIFANGQECTCTVGGQALHCIDVCVDGSQCNVQITNGDMKSGDNLCHAFCYFGKMSGPDAGFDFSDGGMVASTTCPGATVCTDVYGLKGTNRPVGLCL